VVANAYSAVFRAANVFGDNAEEWKRLFKKKVTSLSNKHIDTVSRAAATNPHEEESLIVWKITNSLRGRR